MSAERKAQILAAASNIFLKKGFDAARMEEIAAGAGLSIGGVYWYYKSKEEVILDLMDSITNTDLDDLHALLDVPGTVVERLEAYIRASVPPAEKLSPLFYDFYGLGGRDPRVRSRLQAYFRAYRQVIAALLAQGVARGEFRPLDVESARDPVRRALRRDARDGEARPRQRTGRFRAGQSAWMCCFSACGLEPSLPPERWSLL